MTLSEPWLFVGCGTLVILASAGVSIVRWLRRKSSGLEYSFLLPTALLAVGTLMLVFGWLRLAEAATTRGDALKTGGLASGAVVAMYALWLNDRRRKTEEDRREIERARISDERLEHTIDLLGNEADQVRVGAMHSLSRQAVNDAEYTQIALDLLCSYLRRPFAHPDVVDKYNVQDWSKEVEETIASERHVRSVAQRLITKILKEVEESEVEYELDLGGAVLESFLLEDCYLRAMDFTGARFVGTTTMRWVRIRGWWTADEAKFLGPLHLNVCTIDRASFRNVEFMQDVSFTGTEFGGLNLQGVRAYQRLVFGDVPIIETLWLGLHPKSSPLELLRLQDDIETKLWPQGHPIEFDVENERAVIRPQVTS